MASAAGADLVSAYLRHLTLTGTTIDGTTGQASAGALRATPVPTTVQFDYGDPLLGMTVWHDSIGIVGVRLGTRSGSPTTLGSTNGTAVSLGYIPGYEIRGFFTLFDETNDRILDFGLFQDRRDGRVLSYGQSCDPNLSLSANSPRSWSAVRCADPVSKSVERNGSSRWCAARSHSPRTA